MIWRSIVNCLAITATALLLAGAAQGDEIADIKARGTLKVGMAESPPWQSPDPASGEYEGFNVDMAKRVAEVMEVKLEIVPATWSTLIPGLEAKQYDVVFANLFATPKRALVVNFGISSLWRNSPAPTAGCCYYPDSMTSITIDRS